MAEPGGLGPNGADGHLEPLSGPFSTPRDHATWESHTFTHLNSVRALRSELKRSKNPDIVDPLRTELSSRGRPCGNNTRALEDRLKRRQATEQSIATALVKQMESMEHTVFRVGQSMLELQRGSAAVWSSLNVADKRLELRSKRPAQELVRDAFQEALEQERAELLEAYQQLGEQIQAGQEMRVAVDAAKAELHQNKLTLHVDRTSWPQELLGKTRSLEEAAGQFCSGASRALRRAEEVTARARKATSSSMKQRIAVLVEMRRHLESEIHETRCAIAEAERDLDRMRKIITDHNNAPETRLRGEEPLDFQAIQSRSTLDLESLSKLRATIKGAAYTGHAGRQLDVLFSRFDRDGSGQLDEDEVRRALRRTLKIPPSVITDPEISALYTLLDADDSGSVSIAEIVDFLNADVDVRAMEAEHEQKQATLQQLHVALHEMVANLRCKVAAWKIDDSCLKVTPVKGLELDSLPNLCKTAEQQVPKRKKPLEPRVAERVRAKINKAAYSGGSRRIEELFSRFDKDGSGQLDDDELRRALRSTLKIPTYAISDAEISSLCCMLDADNSGSISISEIIDFVGPEPDDPASTMLEPINTGDGERTSPSTACSPRPSTGHSSVRSKHGPRSRA